LELLECIQSSGQSVSPTIVTVEEQLRGRLAEIHRLTNPRRQIAAYERLQSRIEFLAAWNVLPLNSVAADLFLRFRVEGLRIGSMDLKIACIVLARDATLLTRNVNDFAQVPQLRIENWLD
jgi:tRNA(fMet)-specific endonuclease VapC